MGIKPEVIAARGDEYSHQCAIFARAAELRQQWPELKWLYAVNNQGVGDALYGARKKAEGIKSGVSDMCLPVKRANFCGLYIELKIGKNQPSSNQVEFLNFVAEQGYAGYVCWGWEQAIETICWYMTLPK